MKKVIITMDEKGQFSVNGSGIGSIEILGFLEFAKSTVLKDIMQPKENPLASVSESTGGKSILDTTLSSDAK